MHQIAAAQAGRMQGAGEAPVVGPGPFGIEDRPGRHEHLGELPERRGGQAAERRARRLQAAEVALAQRRQRGERVEARDRVRIDAGEMSDQAGRVVDRVAQQTRAGRRASPRRAAPGSRISSWS